MKICEKINFSSNIVPFAFICSKSVSFSSHINYGQKISLPGPALSPPRTCIITSKELHFHLRDLHYCFQGSAFSPLEPALLLPDLHFNFQVLQIFISEWTLSLSCSLAGMSLLHFHFLQPPGNPATQPPLESLFLLKASGYLAAIG